MVYSSDDKKENLLDSVPQPRVASKELGILCPHLHKGRRKHGERVTCPYFDLCFPP